MKRHSFKLTILLSFFLLQNCQLFNHTDGSDDPNSEPSKSLLLVVPGTIQAENYMQGGEGIGYHDTTPGNTGDVFRPDDVDIDENGDGGYNVGWIASGEWLAYKIRVRKAGNYNIELRVARAWDAANSNVHFEIDNVNISGPIFIHNCLWQFR